MRERLINIIFFVVLVLLMLSVSRWVEAQFTRVLLCIGVAALLVGGGLIITHTRQILEKILGSVSEGAVKLAKACAWGAIGLATCAVMFLTFNAIWGVSGEFIAATVSNPGERWRLLVPGASGSDFPLIMMFLLFSGLLSLWLVTALAKGRGKFWPMTIMFLICLISPVKQFLSTSPAVETVVQAAKAEYEKKKAEWDAEEAQAKLDKRLDDMEREHIRKIRELELKHEQQLKEALLAKEHEAETLRQSSVKSLDLALATVEQRRNLRLAIALKSMSQMPVEVEIPSDAPELKNSEFILYSNEHMINSPNPSLVPVVRVRSGVYFIEPWFQSPNPVSGQIMVRAYRKDDTLAIGLVRLDLVAPYLLPVLTEDNPAIKNLLAEVETASEAAASPGASGVSPIRHVAPAPPTADFANRIWTGVVSATVHSKGGYYDLRPSGIALNMMEYAKITPQPPTWDNCKKILLQIGNSTVIRAVYSYADIGCTAVVCCYSQCKGTHSVMPHCKGGNPEGYALRLGTDDGSQIQVTVEKIIPAGGGGI